MKKCCIAVVAIFLGASPLSHALRADIGPVNDEQVVAKVETPSQLYGQLFNDVQMQRVFPDSKAFADAIPKDDPAAIVARYQRESLQPGFDLAAFAQQNFTVPQAKQTEYRASPGQDVCGHIEALWSVLERRSEEADPHSSLLPLPHPYIVPGGRFEETYYWDAYFIMLGLEASGRPEMALGMLRNLASLIDRYGHVPNGNRTYYLSRSQPPFFAAMVELIAKGSSNRNAIYAEFLAALDKEYSFWMAGADTLAPGNGHRRVVRLRDGTLLNRYWDDRDTPREEAYREDTNTARNSGRPPEKVYRNLRAAAESGWDFSSRWLADGMTLSTIRTTELAPVDLNSAVFQLETTLAKAYDVTGRPERAAELRARAELRKAAVRRYLWDPDKGFFTDYVWRKEKRSDTLTAATLFPLFFGLATRAQAERVAEAVRAKLLKPGGLATSTVRSGQQWDAPNGWAPLQWIGIEGLRGYDQAKLAETIAQRWMLKVTTVYRHTGKLVEKYDVSDPSLLTGGGEYPTQDGFGWTNGVLRKLLVVYPRALAPGPGASGPAALRLVHFPSRNTCQTPGPRIESQLHQALP